MNVYILELSGEHSEDIMVFATKAARRKALRKDMHDVYEILRDEKLDYELHKYGDGICECTYELCVPGEGISYEWRLCERRLID